MKNLWRVLSLLIALGSTIPSEAKEPDPPRGAVLTVRGEGKSEVKPTYALLDASVVSTAATLNGATEAQAERATRAVALTETLKGEGLEIRKSQFALNQTTPRPAPVAPGTQPPPPEPPTFTASTRFTLALSPAGAANRVVSQLAASGLFRINSVSFHVERERQALNDARREAMRDAREQAEVYADAGRFRLIGISAITDGEAAPTEIGQADLPPNWTVQIIPPAVVTFSASVNVTWRIAPAER